MAYGDKYRLLFSGTSEGVQYTYNIYSENIFSFAVTRETNAGEDLSPGSIVSTMVTADVYGDITAYVHNGDKFKVYKWNQADSEYDFVGYFWVNNLKQVGKSRYTFEGFDCISLLEVKINDYLATLIGTSNNSVYSVASGICSQCGLTFRAIDSVYTFPNHDLEFPVGGISTFDDYATYKITARQALSWLAEMCGCYVQTGDGSVSSYTGDIFFSWYDQDNDSETLGDVMYTVVDDNGQTMFTNVCGVVSPSANTHFTYTARDVVSGSGMARPYIQGSLSVENYQCGGVEAINIKFGSHNYTYIPSGTLTDDTYTYSIQDNRFVCNTAFSGLQSRRDVVMQRLYNALHDVVYRPYSAHLISDRVGVAPLNLKPGRYIGIIDYNGNKVKTLLTKVVESSGGIQISATGDEPNGLYQSANQSNGSYTGVSGGGSIEYPISVANGGTGATSSSGAVSNIVNGNAIAPSQVDIVDGSVNVVDLQKTADGRGVVTVRSSAAPSVDSVKLYAMSSGLGGIQIRKSDGSLAVQIHVQNGQGVLRLYKADGTYTDFTP